MGRQAASLILTAGGAFLFGPWGALIGSFLATILFPPPGVSGPRLNELNFQRSTVGAPVPIVYGTFALAGNVIWSSGLIETKHTDKVGGIFGLGGQKVTTYTYSVELAVGICEGEIGGIRRIWADADLIFDGTDDETLMERLQRIVESGELAEIFLGIRAMSAQLYSKLAIYLGDHEQMPDPTIESYEVAGTTPGFRGLAYIVFQDFQLEKFGNRIPNFRFEVYTGASTLEDCDSFTAGHLEVWQYVVNNGVQDPRNPDNLHLYASCIGDMTSPHDTFDAAMADMNAYLDDGEGSYVCSEMPQGVDSEYVRGWSISSTPNYSQPCDAGSGGAGLPSLSVDRSTVSLNLNTIRQFPDSCQTWLPLVEGQACEDFWANMGNQKWVVKWLSAGDASGFWVATDHDVYPTSGGVEPAKWDNRGHCDHGAFGQTAPSFTKYAAFDQELCAKRWWAPRGCAFATPVGGTDEYCIINGELVRALTWTRVSGLFKSLRCYVDTGGTPGVVTSYPHDPTLRNDNLFYNDQDLWESQYALAVAENDSLPLYDANRFPTDWVYGVDYPEERASHLVNIMSGIVWQSSCGESPVASVECVPMAFVIADVARRCGLRTETATQIDVSGITTCVPGYAIGTFMSGRDALVPMRLYGLWDCCESGDVLKFVERGGAIVRTLTSDDLGVHEHGSEAPSRMEVTRVQEKEMPRRLRLKFANADLDHEPSEQSASRLGTEATSEVDLELPVSMSEDNAAQLAEILLYSEWVGRNTYRFSLDHDHLDLEVSDCIEIPVEDETQRVRITTIDYSIGGILKIEAIRDDDGSYVSTAIAAPSTPSGGGLGGAGEGPVCPSGIVLLDIPCTTPTELPIISAAVYGLCESWACAELYVSDDGGVTYGRITTFDNEATVGEIVDISGPPTDPAMPGDSPQYDSGDAITVTLANGELSSITDAQIAAGQNLAAIGVDGAWVIIQFQTATLTTADTYELTDIIWGVQDTRHLLGTTVVGDTFVLLSDAAVIRLTLPVDSIGVAQQYKIVTCGESLDAVDSFNFTVYGLCWERTCPSTVISATTTTPPVSPTDGDAYLLPNDTSLSGAWVEHGGEITFWKDATDSWLFCTPAPGTIIHILPGDTGSGGTSDDGDDVISGGDGTYTPATWARSTESFVTVEDERTRLPNSLRLVGVDSITVTPNTSGELEVGGSAGASPLTTKGDLYTYDTDDQRLAVGTDGDTVIADSTTATGLKWGVFGIPSNAQSGNYTITADDNGRGIDHASGAGAGDTLTIPANGTLALPLGFTFSVFNMDSNDVTVAITTDTLYKAGDGTTGSMTISQYGGASFRKVATTAWLWWGVGTS